MMLKRKNQERTHTPTDAPTEDKRRVGEYFCLAFFVAALLTGVATVPAAVEAARAAGGEDAVGGEWARVFERAYTESLPLRRAATSLIGAARYILLGEGRPGVLVGRDGWLFTAEEYQAEDAEARQKDIEYVTGVAERLAEEGVALVVALVPAKARIYADHAPHPLPAAAADRYDGVLASFKTAGVAAPDLSESLSEAALEEEVFLKTDTHWTPAGAGAAATSIARTVSRNLEGQAIPGTEFREQPGEPVSVTGDLVSFLSLGIFGERLGPKSEVVEMVTLRRSDEASIGLFGDISIPVTLVGTSYSADPRWGFESALKRSLGADVLTVAAEGRGPFEPMSDYLDGEVFSGEPPRLVIWEIPERYVGRSD